MSDQRAENVRTARLRTLLAQTPYRLLCVIGRQRGVPVPHNVSKDALIDRLAQALGDPDALQAACAGLPAPAQAVLHDLVLAGGRLPRAHIARRHGDFRPYRPWRAEAPDRPWDHPRTPTARLYFLGLLFWDEATGDLVLPADLLAHYPRPPAPGGAPVEAPADALAPALAACHDVAQLLALLEAEPIRPLHGRWLSPRPLHAWGERCVRPPAHPDARSELQTSRRCFLHYLAESAGLVACSGPFLKPTPAAWSWVEAAPRARVRTLWTGLDDPPSARWARYRLPGRDHAAIGDLLAAVRRMLRAEAPDPPTSATVGTGPALAGRLLARDPAVYDALYFEIATPDPWLTSVLASLIEGPLTWAGLVVGAPDDELRLTAWGAWGLDLDEPPPTPPAPPFTLTVPLTFRPPAPPCDPAALLALAACGTRDPAGRYHVTKVAWIRAIQRGYCAPDLIARLTRLAQRPLTGAEIANLTGWAEAADRMTIRRLTVLEVDDPAVLVRLGAKRRGRRTIARTLGRRAVVVDEAHLSALVRRLTEQEGVPPQVELPPAEDADPAGLGPGGAAHLWLAARFYQILGRMIELPVHVPHALVDHLAGLADPGALSAARAALDRSRAALADAREGRAAFPPWGGPVSADAALSEAEAVACIEAALTQGQALEMTYYTAGRDATSHRVVEPYRLEVRNGVAYLIGFCQRAQAARTFRVDRIRELARIPMPPEWHGGLDL